MNYSPTSPPPVLSTFELRGRGARGHLVPGAEYTFEFYVDHALGVVRVETPMSRVNEFDDYGSPTCPEQEAAIDSVFQQLGVPCRAPWTATTEFALADLTRVREALAALLESPSLGRAREAYWGAFELEGKAHNLSVFLFDPALPAKGPFSLESVCAPHQRAAVRALLLELAPGAVDGPPLQDRVRLHVDGSADLPALRGRLRARFPAR